MNLAAANASAGHDKEAQEAVAKLRDLYPDLTVQTFASIHWSDDPTFNAQYQRIVESCSVARSSQLDIHPEIDGRLPRHHRESGEAKRGNGSRVKNYKGENRPVQSRLS